MSKRPGTLFMLSAGPALSLFHRHRYRRVYATLNDDYEQCAKCGTRRVVRVGLSHRNAPIHYDWVYAGADAGAREKPATIP